MTEAEWRSCDWPYYILRHLDGKIPDEAFISFSVACCRRIWPLFLDSRARAVVETTERIVKGDLTWNELKPVYAAWYEAYENDNVEDLAGGSTNEAVESVCGVGMGHAAQVAMACFEAAGYSGSHPLRQSNAPQAEITRAWDVAEKSEREAQCQMLREMFGYNPDVHGSGLTRRST